MFCCYVITIFAAFDSRNVIQLSLGQTIAACQCNITQHCWAQHVGCVWSPCCEMLRHVGCCWLKFEDGQILIQQHLTCLNTTQHGGTTWRPNAPSMLRPTMLRYVALACCDGALFYMYKIFLNIYSSHWNKNIENVQSSKG